MSIFSLNKCGGEFSLKAYEGNKLPWTYTCIKMYLCNTIDLNERPAMHIRRTTRDKRKVKQNFRQAFMVLSDAPN